MSLCFPADYHDSRVIKKCILGGLLQLWPCQAAYKRVLKGGDDTVSDEDPNLIFPPIDKELWNWKSILGQC